MNLINNLVKCGLTNTLDYYQKRGILISNYISLILSVVMVIIFVCNYLFFGKNLFDKLVIGLIVFLSPIILNKYSFITLSRILVCTIPVLFVWYVFISEMLKMTVIEVSVYDGLRIYLLAFCFFPYLLFDKSNWLVLLVGVLPTLISILFFNFFLSLAGFSDAQYNLPHSDYAVRYFRTIISFIIISLSCYAFHSIINQNDEFNQKIVSELKKKTIEIEVQNAELNISQTKLYDLNQRLEEIVNLKTLNIQKQNEVLINYSYTNAHHLRGPVARILGLVQLLKMEKETNYPFFFEKVENEAIDIDRIIKRISKDLESTEF